MEVEYFDGGCHDPGGGDPLDFGRVCFYFLVELELRDFAFDHSSDVERLDVHVNEGSVEEFGCVQFVDLQTLEVVVLQTKHLAALVALADFTPEVHDAGGFAFRQLLGVSVGLVFVALFFLQAVLLRLPAHLYSGLRSPVVFSLAFPLPPASYLLIFFYFDKSLQVLLIPAEILGCLYFVGRSDFLSFEFGELGHGVNEIVFEMGPVATRVASQEHVAQTRAHREFHTRLFEVLQVDKVECKIEFVQLFAVS